MFSSNSSQRRGGVRRRQEPSRRGNPGYSGVAGVGTRVQTQEYKQDTKQLQNQMLFVEQAKATFVVVESHLDNLVRDADPSVLTATSSGVVSCLNLMRNTAMTHGDDRQGFLAIKSILKQFNEKCERKYARVSGDKQVKIDAFKEAVTRHLLSVLNGETDTPVIAVAPMESVPPPDTRGRGRPMEGVVSNSMGEYMRGNHRLADLEQDVEANSGKYREQIANAARAGAQFEQEEEVHQGSFDARHVSILQHDMASVGVVRNEAEDEAEALASLKRLNERSAGFANIAFDSNEQGEPDLIGRGMHGHRHGVDAGVEDMDQDERAPAQKSSYWPW